MRAKKKVMGIGKTESFLMGKLGRDLAMGKNVNMVLEGHKERGGEFWFQVFLHHLMFPLYIISPCT